MSRRKRIIHRSRAALATFLQTESSGGYVLLVAVVLALVWANVGGDYHGFWEQKITAGGVTKDIRHWINDGLMTIFFFVVGLEIKRELVTGELRDRRVASLPLLGAIGGMALPALLYVALNPSGVAVAGWAIPMATDIAFVVGALALLGPRAPDGLKVFLLALAIIDDIGAIAVIALFYAGGVHPTIVGVVLGLLIPARRIRGRLVAKEIQDVLHPVSSFAVVPLFALANAGVVVTGDTLASAMRSRVVLGIIAGLVVGKTLGIFGFAAFGDRFGLGRRPAGVHWHHLIGGSALAGIGFTVSLFIAGLAFDDESLVEQARFGVLVGSVCSAAIGALILAFFRRRSDRRSPA